MLLNASREQALRLARNLQKLDERLNLITFADVLHSDDISRSIKEALPFSYWTGWGQLNAASVFYDQVIEGRPVKEADSDVLIVGYDDLAPLLGGSLDTLLQSHKLLVVCAPPHLPLDQSGALVAALGRPLHLLRSDDRVLYVFKGER